MLAKVQAGAGTTLVADTQVTVSHDPAYPPLTENARIDALDGLGLVGGDFHTDHEWVDLNSLVPRLYLFTRLLMEAGNRP